MAAKKKPVARVREGVTGSLQVGDSNTYIDLDPDTVYPADHPVVVNYPDCFTITEAE